MEESMPLLALLVMKESIVFVCGLIRVGIGAASVKHLVTLSNFVEIFLD
jgi:hypothetical protein